jgi:MFS family permease
MAVLPVAMGIVAPFAGSMSDRVGTRIITVVGLVILFFGYAGLTRLTIQTGALTFALLMVPVGVGMGTFQSPNNSAIMGSAPPGKLGIVSGMLALNRSLAQITGIAIIGAVWAALTLSYAPSSQITNAADASAPAQVTALQHTFIVVAAVILAALLIAVWTLMKESHGHSQAV